VSVLLAIGGLTKAFRAPDGETTPIIDVPRFTLDAGEEVALHGASGTGKTTFLHLIAGLLQADTGEIRVVGEDVGRMTESARDRWRARALGYVFQNFNLLQGYTVLENVMLGMLFGRGVDEARCRRLLDRVGLGHRLSYRPSQLSIGQQQRVAVARALANQPSLVLADEPTGNLDARHAAEALALIRDICREQRAALLLVSHDPVVLGAFDRQENLARLNRAVRDVPAAARP
jgi:putative ABC transport system ATP-binding protein